MDSVAENGYLYILKFLYENTQERCTEQGLQMASCRGHFHIVKWLCENATYLDKKHLL